ncbi:M48 family metallopeptidase [Pseudoduganella violaceinigra]|uniref:M48 family metallopeptidase n=1 Tax=Pseudoduganella violaceinigra TaxID=246602 RepID=UPI000403D68F|nr:M48 family metallopeptidase [Pseudoduganella violaceinigra]
MAVGQPVKSPYPLAWPAIAAALLLSACSTLQPGGEPPVPAQPLPPAEPPAPVVTPQMQAARDQLKVIAGLQERLYRIAAPLLINNADLCKTQARNLLGFTAKNKYSYPGEYADASTAVLGYDDVLQISGVLAGSGAARAGLRKGDDLLAAGGKPLPRGRDAESKAAAVFGPLTASSATLSMTIGRNGNSQTLNVPVTRACAFRVDLGNSDNVNAYNDGSRVLLTRGMINFAQNDEAIAYVMAKELAHNILGHTNQMKSTATVSSLIDNLTSVRPDLTMLVGSAGVRPMPPDYDVAADNLALYMLARAGYNIGNARSFWQRLSGQYPATVLNGYTAIHPNVTARLAAMDRSVSEIKAKQAAKRPLLP